MPSIQGFVNSVVVTPSCKQFLVPFPRQHGLLLCPRPSPRPCHCPICPLPPASIRAAAEDAPEPTPQQHPPNAHTSFVNGEFIPRSRPEPIPRPVPAKDTGNVESRASASQPPTAHAPHGRSATGRALGREVARLRGRAERAAATLALRVRAAAALALRGAADALAHGPLLGDGGVRGGWGGRGAGAGWQPLRAFRWQRVLGAEGDGGEDRWAGALLRGLGVVEDEGADWVRARQRAERRREVVKKLRGGGSGVWRVSLALMEGLGQAGVVVAERAMQGIGDWLVGGCDGASLGEGGRTQRSISGSAKHVLVAGRKSGNTEAKHWSGRVVLKGEVSRRDLVDEVGTLGKGVVSPKLQLSSKGVPAIQRTMKPDVHVGAKARGVGGDSVVEAVQQAWASGKVVRSTVGHRGEGLSGLDIGRLEGSGTLTPTKAGNASPVDYRVGAGAGAAVVGLGLLLGPAVSAAVTATAAAAASWRLAERGGSLVENRREGLAAARPKVKGLRRSKTVRDIDKAIEASARGGVQVSVASALQQQSHKWAVLLGAWRGVHYTLNKALWNKLGHFRIPGVSARVTASDDQQVGEKEQSLRFAKSGTVARDSVRTDMIVGDAAEGITGPESQTERFVDDSVVAHEASLDEAESVRVDAMGAKVGEGVVDTDAYATLPSEPAVFSIPIVGVALECLDRAAYSIEQTLGRVIRRLYVRLPLGMTALFLNDRLEVHRTLQGRANEDVY